MTDDPRDRLADLGSTEAPPPDPVFAERLEQRLRSVATVSPTPATPPPRRGRWTGLVLRPSVAVAIIALIGIVGATVFRASDSPDEVLALTAARSSTMVLPDGTEIAAMAGLEVPDGAIIEVGPDGAVTIGGIDYQAGTILEITDGRVRTISDRPDDQPTDRPAPPPTSGPERVVDQPSVTDRPSPPPTNAPVSPPLASTAPPSSAVDRPPASPSSTSTAPTTVITAPAVTLEAVGLAEGRWRLVWSISGDTSITGWVVRGAAGDPAPDPRGPAGRLVASLRESAQRELVVRPPADAAEVAYVVEARGADGTLLATSNQATVTVGAG
ncbi:MAG: hypothetical protein GY929_13295 [Actinomycetia bacterium]|nr:hypothetical protein [Actinomycetes bacterium]